MENNENKRFKYSYSAAEQEELKRIRSKYEEKEADSRESKMEYLRKLDKSAAKKGTTAAVVVGIIGALLLGVGMCCTMVWADDLFVIGIIVGVIGIGAAALAYPLYDRIAKKERKKIAPEIKKLTDELMSV
ncbi:MAG: hypothetical protein HDT47_04225 [Ruminococcaceae bacterium]|nr:hypothetical protein [Oscillospiraceae bacterium]